MGWLTLRDEKTRTFLLSAQRNLPEGWARKRNQPVDDGISSLVTLSAESLVMHGEPLQKFKIALLGRSAGVVPIKVQNEVIGLLIVVRKEDLEISREAQTLLEAVSDFASISLVNARLFRALEHAAESASDGEKQQNALLERIRHAASEEVHTALHPLNQLLAETPGKLNEAQKNCCALQEAMQRLAAGRENCPANLPPVKNDPMTGQGLLLLALDEFGNRQLGRRSRAGYHWPLSRTRGLHKALAESTPALVLIGETFDGHGGILLSMSRWSASDPAHPVVRGQDSDGPARQY
jgi:hypothetical protein